MVSAFPPHDDKPNAKSGLSFCTRCGVAATRGRAKFCSLSSEELASRVGQGADAYTAEGKDTRDELSLALARQRELETERDEAQSWATMRDADNLALVIQCQASLSRQRELEEALRRPISMQDVRLAVGEGKLSPLDLLAGCNAELRRRAALLAPKTGGDHE